MNLRKIACDLGRRVGQKIVPVSLLHSHKIDRGDLGGRPAELIDDAMRRLLDEGEHDFLVIPLFFGPSRGITNYLPKRIARLKEDYPKLAICIAPCLFDINEGTDIRVATILKERITELVGPEDKPPVVLVDHGSPVPEVTRVRDFVAGQLSSLLQGRISRFVAASMEKRPGDQYSFAGPLMEDVLNSNGFNQGRVIVSMMFISPGRHAGEGGDISEICDRAGRANPGLVVERTGLVGGHSLLIEILADRLRAAFAMKP